MLDNPYAYFHIGFYQIHASYFEGSTEVVNAGGATAISTGYQYNVSVVNTIRCDENRFGNDTVGKGANLSDYWCPEYVDFNLTGSWASKTF